MPEFDHILWKDTDSVKGLFSLKNSSHRKEAEIPGLNLGYNTPESAEITLQNQQEWLRFAGANPKKTALSRQIHSANVQVVNKGGVYPDNDGFVSNTPGISLGIFVADCGGILLFDEKNGVIGACHAGWKGAVGGIVPKTIGMMIELGAEINEIEAFISPCISVERFEVGEEVAEQFPKEFINRKKPKPHVDLKGFIAHSMMKSGLMKTNITMSDGCTISDSKAYYSYRREKEKSGRMMALITLKNNR